MHFLKIKCIILIVETLVIVISTGFVIVRTVVADYVGYYFYGKIFIMNTIFCERLRELRKERKLGQIALADALDVGKSVVSLWELGKCEPTLSKLVAMAKFFDVSIDYLAGLED